MNVIDLYGDKMVRSAPLVVDADDKTLICNGQLIFNGCDGIKFKPTKPSSPVRVSMLSLRDLDIFSTGNCMELIGCGKETTIDNVRCTGTGGVIVKDWDGGSIQNLYCFDCHEYGLRIDRMHAAELRCTVRQTRNGPGVWAKELRGVNGSIYSESNDGIGLVLEDCNTASLMLHLENNNRGITGETVWESMGHRYKQLDIRASHGLHLTGFYGKETGQWTSDTASAKLLDREYVRATRAKLVEPQWDAFWPNKRHRPKVTCHGRTAHVTYPKGCFLHENQNHNKSQRWHLFGESRLLPPSVMCRCSAFVQVPPNIVADLSAMHDRGEPNALGTLGFGGFEYDATWYDKAYVSLHVWNGPRYEAAISTTWTRAATKCYPNYQPCSGIGSWNNPEFEATYTFRYSVVE